MKRNPHKKNFDRLVGGLCKYCLDAQGRHSDWKYPKPTYFSKKYNSYISERIVYAGRISGMAYMQKEMDMFRGTITREEWQAYHNEFVAQNPWWPDASRDSKFRVFTYLKNDKFCLDIEENKVRTQLIVIPVPDKIVGDHNGAIQFAFEQSINKQIDKYLRQKRTNIDIIKELPITN